MLTNRRDVFAPAVVFLPSHTHKRALYIRQAAHAHRLSACAATIIGYQLCTWSSYALPCVFILRGVAHSSKRVPAHFLLSNFKDGAALTQAWNVGCVHLPPDEKEIPHCPERGFTAVNEKGRRCTCRWTSEYTRANVWMKKCKKYVPVGNRNSPLKHCTFLVVRSAEGYRHWRIWELLNSKYFFKSATVFLYFYKTDSEGNFFWQVVSDFYFCTCFNSSVRSNKSVWSKTIDSEFNSKCGWIITEQLDPTSKLYIIICHFTAMTSLYIIYTAQTNDSLAASPQVLLSGSDRAITPCNGCRLSLNYAPVARINLV